jgi:hypothetical protein
MANLWQFFGLPDPDGSTPVNRRQPARATQQQRPVNLETRASEASPTEESIESMAAESPPTLQPLRAPPLGWSGPLTPDGEPFHDLAVVSARPPPPPRTALRYIAPDEMKRLPTEAMLQRVMQGDTAIVDLRPLVHMESHQMACRREIKHKADDARISVFALDAEDKLLMVPGHNVVVDMAKHELGLTALI